MLFRSAQLPHPSLSPCPAPSPLPISMPSSSTPSYLHAQFINPLSISMPSSSTPSYLHAQFPKPLSISMPSSSTPSYLNAQSVPPLLHLHAQPISESCYPAGFLKVHYPTLRHDTLMTKPDLAQTENQESQLNQCLAYNSQSAYCA